MYKTHPMLICLRCEPSDKSDNSSFISLFILSLLNFDCLLKWFWCRITGDWVFSSVIGRLPTILPSHWSKMTFRKSPRITNDREVPWQHSKWCKFWHQQFLQMLIYVLYQQKWGIFKHIPFVTFATNRDWFQNQNVKNEKRL